MDQLPLCSFMVWLYDRSYSLPDIFCSVLLLVVGVDVQGHVEFNDVCPGWLLYSLLDKDFPLKNYLSRHSAIRTFTGSPG